MNKYRLHRIVHLTSVPAAQVLATLTRMKDDWYRNNSTWYYVAPRILKTASRLDIRLRSIGAGACGYIPPNPDYYPCTRSAHLASEPCAHRYRGT